MAVSHDAPVIYPGSFDPMTNGHLDVARRAARLFSRVIVAVVANPNKRPMFAAQARVAMLREACGDLPNVEVASFDGLLVDFVRQRNARLIVKGLRIVADFEGEFTMALINRKLAGSVDTMFLPASVEYAYVSSSSVREIFALGGDVSGFVPPSVLRAMADLRRDVG